MYDVAVNTTLALSSLPLQVSTFATANSSFAVQSFGMALFGQVSEVVIANLAWLVVQTVFSCTMRIPGTQFSLKEERMYRVAGEAGQAGASQLYSSDSQSRPDTVILLLLFGLHRTQTFRSCSTSHLLHS